MGAPARELELAAEDPLPLAAVLTNTEDVVLDDSNARPAVNAEPADNPWRLEEDAPRRGGAAAAEKDEEPPPLYPRRLPRAPSSFPAPSNSERSEEGIPLPVKIDVMGSEAPLEDI